jgi:sulfur transfer complex TusBCD TusB component (DsrH family)
LEEEQLRKATTEAQTEAEAAQIASLSLSHALAQKQDEVAALQDSLTAALAEKREEKRRRKWLAS